MSPVSGILSLAFIFAAPFIVGERSSNRWIAKSSAAKATTELAIAEFPARLAL